MSIKDILMLSFCIRFLCSSNMSHTWSWHTFIRKNQLLWELMFMLSLIYAIDMIRTYKTKETFSLLQYNSERFLVSVKAKKGKLWRNLMFGFVQGTKESIGSVASVFRSRILRRFVPWFFYGFDLDSSHLLFCLLYTCWYWNALKNLEVI